MQHSVVDDWLHYLFPFGLGGAMKADQEEDDLLANQICVCRAAPGYPWLCPGLLNMGWH